MGNIFKKEEKVDPDSAWQEQNKEVERNPMYKFADLVACGKLIKAYRTGGVVAVQEIARKEIKPYLYNEGKGRKLSKLDIIKWRHRKDASRTGSAVWETKTDEELLAEWNEKEKNSFNKVTEHEMCWDLDKRGGVGETPIHLLFLMDSAEHVETAKILLNMFPKLALDLYEADEYFGESCLHLATIYGDFESVKLLVSNGAFVNVRASGRFFLPEDQKNGRANNTNYNGYAYYGEYPLAFAVCAGFMDIYDYLIDNGADPNLQDSFGNTSLHLAVIADKSEMYKYMVKHHKKPAKANIRNNANLTPLTLASKLGRHNLFKEILEINSIDFWRYSNVTCSAYPLTEVDSISPNGEPNRNSALMIVIDGEEDDHLDMLEGGVMRQLLDDKWKTFARRRFFERLVLAFIHLSLISVAVYLRPATDLAAYVQPSDGIRFTAEIIVCLFCIAYLFLEVYEIGSQGFLGFVKNCVHAPAHTVFMFSCLLILMCIPFRFLNRQVEEDILMILAVPCSWFFLLFFARSVKLTGPFVTMIYKMCVGDLMRFGIIYLIFLGGFTQGFYFLFRDINNDSFNTLPATIMTLFQMTLGEFKYHDFDLTRYALLTKLVFAVFMILVPILLLNMLIAMMGNTYQTVIAKSEKEWRKQWAKIVVVLERGFTKKQLQRYHREYTIKMEGPTSDDDDTLKEIRALVVIKTSPKTKARQRKIAVGNWKKLGREIIIQLKDQKKKGKSGPLRLQKVNKKAPAAGGNAKKKDGSDSEDDMKFTNITQQLAWERDIDLTKGQAFTKDPGIIENTAPHTPRQSNGTNPPPPGGNLTQEHETQYIPNGSATRTKKYVKKPNGTPKSSPKIVHKQISSNRVTPLPFSKQESELEFDLDKDRTLSTRLSMSQFTIVRETDSMPRGDDPYGSIFNDKNDGTKSTGKENGRQSVVKHDDGYVSHASHDTSHDTKSPTEAELLPRATSTDSKAMYDQWVNELIESSPGPSPSRSMASPGTKHKKRKKDKKEKKDKKRDKSRDKSKERKEKKDRRSTPTSQEMLISDGSEVEESGV